MDSIWNWCQANLFADGEFLDDPNMAGEIESDRLSLKPVSWGTEISVVASGIAEVISLRCVISVGKICLPNSGILSSP